MIYFVESKNISNPTLPAMNENAIEINSLTRYFGTKCAVNQLSLQIPKGSIFGLLGRNGAGKTTTIRILMGLMSPTRGSARVLDYDCQSLPPEARERIGYLAEGHHIYGWMTLRECGKFQSSFFRKWNSDIFHSILNHFRLDERAKAGNLSRGQRAGLCLALTLAPEPELLVLDDPALGLDPVARRSLLESMLYVTRKDNRTILFSSHLLSDVERVADRIAVVHQGVLRADCPVETFCDHIRQYVIRYNGTAPDISTLPGLLHSFRTDKEISVTCVKDDALKAALEKLPGEIIEVPLGLEDAFVSYVGERGEKSFFLENTKHQEATR
ncbi:MAG: ABC transporter ATP-binding protein [Chthoniobacterales bacterium]